MQKSIRDRLLINNTLRNSPGGIHYAPEDAEPTFTLVNEIY